MQCRVTVLREQSLITGRERPLQNGGGGDISAMLKGGHQKLNFGVVLTRGLEVLDIILKGNAKGFHPLKGGGVTSFIFQYNSKLSISPGTCSEETTFQCYDGTCIPRGRVCDSTVDCPGVFGEDEANEICLQDNALSCRDWRMKGFTENGRYLVRYAKEGQWRGPWWGFPGCMLNLRYGNVSCHLIGHMSPVTPKIFSCPTSN